MNVSDFDYDLPEAFIAQTPVEPRDSSRLMVVNRETGAIEHHLFREIVDFISPGDVLALNTTRVIPARLKAVKAETGGSVEVLLLRKLDEQRWRALVGGRRVITGTRLVFVQPSPPSQPAVALPSPSGRGGENAEEISIITAEVVETLDDAERVIRFDQPVNGLLGQMGEMPLPPYIRARLSDPERYQTIYSQQEGSAAAPTAGLHFTPELLLALRDKSVKMAHCQLHIGLDTFQPVRVDEVEQHHIHSERAILSADDARIINEAKLAGGRIIAVGTTVARTLETAGILSAGGDPAHPTPHPRPLSHASGERGERRETEACPWRPVIAFEGDTNLFIYPGYRWRVVEAMITNFHLPRSTLLMMVSAFAGREHILNAYETAKREGYRFFSFGDAMFIR